MEPAAEAAPIVLRTATYIKVGDIDPPPPGTVGEGDNLVVCVSSSTIVIDKARVDGTPVKIAEVVVGDETGCITFRARNEQIDILQPGAVVVIRNGIVEMFRGHMRLVVNKWGKISPHPDGIASTPPAPPSVNLNNDKSATEYELADGQDDEVAD